MTDWPILVVGVLAVSAAWDVGRRFVEKIATKHLQAEVDALAKRISELEEMPEQVAELANLTRGIKNSLEAQKAGAQRRPNWPTGVR